MTGCPEIPFQDLRTTNAGLTAELEAAASRVIRSGRYINGPEVTALEHELAAACGTARCVAVSTGLDALRLILRAYMELGRLREGDEVVVPANTFIATFLAVTDCGLTPVAADVDEATFCLDFSRLPLTGKTRAVIAVHLFGLPCWNPEAVRELREGGVIVIEDNAQALGASTAEGRPTGSLGDAAAISFYPAKNVGALGDAGAVVTDDGRLADTVRMLANYGAREKYRHELRGLNCRMDELQAALLRVKLPLLPEITRRRGETARLYDSLISNPDVTKPRIPADGTVAAWHQYVVRHPRRDDLRAWLARGGVGTEIHYPVACHRQKCYEGTPLSRSRMPMAERLAGEILSLPIADVSPGEAQRVACLINSFENQQSR